MNLPSTAELKFKGEQALLKFAEKERRRIDKRIGKPKTREEIDAFLSAYTSDTEAKREARMSREEAAEQYYWCGKCREVVLFKVKQKRIVNYRATLRYKCERGHDKRF